jgi:mannitol-1-phosphate/altronate dehydrogenase
MKVFFDAEFTGLHQNTTLISIGLVAEDGDTFYAELTDFARDQVDEWIQENVIDGLTLLERMVAADDNHMSVSGNKKTVQHYLRKWLVEQSTKDGQKLEMWSDCYAYDWVLLCDVFGGAFRIPD